MSDVETRAREMGWKPQEEYRGDPSKWVDADTYVERGETVLPIVKAQKERLEKEVARLNEQVGELTTAFKGSQEAIKALEEFYSEETKRQVEKARADLKRQIRTAREEGNVDQELEAQEELTRLNAAERKAAETPGPNDSREDKRAAPPPPSPEYKAWEAENPWFGADKKKTNRAVLMGAVVADENPELKGKAFFDELDRRLIAEGVKEGRPRPNGRVDEGGDRAGGGGKRNPGYDDLPADAKAACDKQATRLVGKDPRFKTEADWRRYYVEQYNKEY